MDSFLPTRRRRCTARTGWASRRSRLGPPSVVDCSSGIAEPSLAVTAPQRRSVKTVFLTVDCTGAVTLILPYAPLEQEARCCMRALVTAELALSDCRIEVLTSP